MHQFIPNFDTDDDYVNNPNSSSSLNLPKQSITMGGHEDDDLMELLWQNGQVVVQNQRLATKKPQPSPPMQHHHHQPLDKNLSFQEDEMTPWLHYHLRDDDFCSELLFSGATCTTTERPVTRPPVRNFMNFSRLRGDFHNGRGESGQLFSKVVVRESTQVSPRTPSSAVCESGVTRSAVAGGGLDRKGKAVAEIPGTSSSVVGKSDIEPEKTNVDERKRKEREPTEETECRSVVHETKEAGGSTSSKRSRAAEVHNLSERKRRDRINEKMKVLQELIPRCNKSDKASMLDEVIEYLKSLQLQIQMMSMGCGMMPMMYPGMQQYMPHMAMRMGMGMNQPLPPPSFMPFPNMLGAQRPFPTQSPMGISAPQYPVHFSDPSRLYVQNQQCDQNSSQPQYPGCMDSYQQFRSVHPSQPPQFQNQATSYPSSSRASSSKDSSDQLNHTTS